MKRTLLLLLLTTLPGIAAADQADLGPYGCASVDGGATCDEGVAVSVLGDAQGGPLGAYYEPSAALSVSGDAGGGDAAVAPAGDASSPGGAAASGTGSARGWWAASVAGPSEGTWAASAAGPARGWFLSVSILGDVTAGGSEAQCGFPTLSGSSHGLPCAAVSVFGRAEGPVAVSACNLYGPFCL